MPDQPTPPPERTALYRYFDADGALLYIGISKEPEGRWLAHRGNREPWIHRAARRVDEWYDSRDEALTAEAAAIRAERPLFNGKHNYDDVTFDSSTWSPVEGAGKVSLVAGLMRRDIRNGIWPVGYRIPPLKALGAAAGVSASVVSKASSALRRAGLLRFDSGHGLFVCARSPRPKLPHDWPRSCGFPG